MSEWARARAIAEALKLSDRAVQLRAQRESWQWRKAAGRGGGREYAIASLPQDLQARLVVHLGLAAASSPPAAAANDDGERSRALWAEYDRKPGKVKAVAERRLDVVVAVELLVERGTPRMKAIATVAELKEEPAPTIRRWLGLMKGVARADWLPTLAPRWSGRTQTTHCDPEAWEVFKADYLRDERPCAEACYERLERIAAKHGWVYPCLRTLMRRLARELNPAAITLARYGADAVKRQYPAQERDHSVFHALEAVNADGHRFDIGVEWEDGEKGRVVVVVWQDIYSGKILAWRDDRTENADVVRLALSDLVERYGTPDHGYLDNGRGFASKWMTGGTPNRYRFKVRAEDAAGIMTVLGIRVHWTQPYSGQSKPVERAFRDWCDRVAKHPRFAGAYLGNSPTNKPANYGSRHVPIAEFRRVLAEEIVAHNARVGRRSPVCAGRSFDQVFEESYAHSFIRKATAEQRRMLLLAAEGVTADRETGAVKLFGNRYWTDDLALARAAGSKVVVRFDPAHLDEPVHIYALDGRFIATAPRVEKAGFDDTQAAREHARARKGFIKAQKDQLAAERRMSALEVAAMLPSPEAPPPPETSVVRPMFGAGGTALAAAPAMTPEERDERFSRGMELLRAQKRQGL